MRALLAAFALLLLVPVASAQAPDPAEVVAEACSAVGGVLPQARDLLPVCPRADPAPATAADEERAHPPAPEEAAQLVEEVLEDVRAIPEDPASAGERVASILATLVQFVRDVLGSTGDGVADAREALDAAAAGARERAGRAVDGARNVVASVAEDAREAAACTVEKVKELLTIPSRAPAPAPAPSAKLPGAAPRTQSVVDGVTSLLRS